MSNFFSKNKETGLLFWLIIVIVEIIKNIKDYHFSEKLKDMIKHFLVCASMCLSPYAFPGMEYQ